MPNLRASDFPLDEDEPTEFRANMYVRRSDGPIATVAMDAAGLEEPDDEPERVRLCFRAKRYVVYTHALWRADDASDMHCIRPECEFYLTFSNACDDSLLGDNQQLPLSKRRRRRQTAEELNRPVRIDADDASLSSPLLEILHAYDPSLLAENYLDDEDTLTFLTALNWA